MLFDKSWLVNSIFKRELQRVAKQYATGRLIDIGCGTKPFKKLFAPYVTEHIGVDHENTIHDQSNIDLFGTAYSIPAEDNSFDTAISTAVLEHLEEPAMSILETHRILKKGGHAIYSAPLYWQLHEEPRDFFRYTKYGLKHLFEKNGFEIVEITALSGFWVTFGQQSISYIARSLRRPLQVLFTPLILFIQLSCFLFNRFDKSTEFTWMYLIIARKKGKQVSYEKNSNHPYP